MRPTEPLLETKRHHHEPLPRKSHTSVNPSNATFRDTLGSPGPNLEHTVSNQRVRRDERRLAIADTGRRNPLLVVPVEQILEALPDIVGLEAGQDIGRGDPETDGGGTGGAAHEEGGRAGDSVKAHG